MKKNVFSYERCVHNLVLIYCLVAGTNLVAHAEPNTVAADRWAMHAQLTSLIQHHASFASPYQGQSSRVANGRTDEITDITLYAGWRILPNTELWFNPEVYQGFGLNNTVGMAGFPSGEAYKVGSNVPYLRLPRAFMRHVFNLGGDSDQIDSAPNQFRVMRDSENVTITVGKFSVTDIFDTNGYAHDPRVDFVNLSLIDAGAFDYAADAWGFTYGAAVEWNHGSLTIRTGIFQLSSAPNGKVVRVNFRQHMLVGELEWRYLNNALPGKIKLTGFANRVEMARYDDASKLGLASGAAPEVAPLLKRVYRPGLALNIEQDLGKSIGAFFRASVNDGTKEAYELTEINHSVSGGVSIKGSRWGRADDTIGIAAVANSLSADALRYFAGGGTGILIGDGNLNYGSEKVVEAYYSMQLVKNLTLSFDFQHVNNPAYQRSRGPVNIESLRLHAEF